MKGRNARGVNFTPFIFNCGTERCFILVNFVFEGPFSGGGNDLVFSAPEQINGSRERQTPRNNTKRNVKSVEHHQLSIRPSIQLFV